MRPSTGKRSRDLPNPPATVRNCRGDKPSLRLSVCITTALATENALTCDAPNPPIGPSFNDESRPDLYLFTQGYAF